MGTWAPLLYDEAVSCCEALLEGPDGCVEEPATREDECRALPARLDDASVSCRSSRVLTQVRNVCSTTFFSRPIVFSSACSAMSPCRTLCVRMLTKMAANCSLSGVD